MMETNTFKPEISENSKLIMKNLTRKHMDDEFKSRYLPIYEEARLKEIEAHRQIKIDRIKDELRQREMLRKEEEDDILRIVQKKTDPSRYNEEEFLENIETNLKKYFMKKEKEREEHDSKYSGITFKPTISKKSKNMVKRKNGAKTFRERQAEFEQKNKQKQEKLKLELAPSFKPTLNKKSKLLQKRLKGSSSHKRLLSIESASNISKSASPKKREKDPIACHLNYDIEEIEEEQNEEISNQMIRATNEEIQEISDFINNSKPKITEYDLNSQAIMDMIFSKTDKIQEELDQFNSNREHQEINDRDLDDLEEQIEHQEAEELNDREEDSDEDGRVHLDINEDNRDMQEYLQNGLNQPIGENKQEQFLIPQQQRRQQEVQLETVDEATVEDTQEEEKVQEEEREAAKSKRNSKVSDLLGIPKSESSRILRDYNSYMQSEEESGRIEPEEVVEKAKKLEDRVKKTKPKKGMKPEELGLGSMELLDKILKQYKHCVK
jgi:hypothetical protein